jgi:hypothetical protein
MSIRFPSVSSSIPVTLLNETPSRPISRPRTAPQMQASVQPKTDLTSKSAGTYQENLHPIAEHTAAESLNTKPNVTQPTKVDLQRDVQILTLDDDENPNEQLIYGENEQTPF